MRTKYTAALRAAIDTCLRTCISPCESTFVHCARGTGLEPHDNFGTDRAYDAFTDFRHTHADDVLPIHRQHLYTFGHAPQGCVQDAGTRSFHQQEQRGHGASETTSPTRMVLSRSQAPPGTTDLMKTLFRLAVSSLLGSRSCCISRPIPAIPALESISLVKERDNIEVPSILAHGSSNTWVWVCYPSPHPGSLAFRSSLQLLWVAVTKILKIERYKFFIEQLFL